MASILASMAHIAVHEKRGGAQVATPSKVTGATRGIRTHDLYITNALLYH